MKSSIMAAICLAGGTLVACASPNGATTSTVARHDLNSVIWDCQSLTPAERASATPRTGCVETGRQLHRTD
jgi:hypothetical protein